MTLDSIRNSCDVLTISFSVRTIVVFFDNFFLCLDNSCAGVLVLEQESEGQGDAEQAETSLLLLPQRILHVPGLFCTFQVCRSSNILILLPSLQTGQDNNQSKQMIEAHFAKRPNHKITIQVKRYFSTDIVGQNQCYL